jgi:hypothetical protein
VFVFREDFQNPQKQEVFAGAYRDVFTAALKILTEYGHEIVLPNFKVLMSAAAPMTIAHQPRNGYTQRQIIY